MRIKREAAVRGWRPAAFLWPGFRARERAREGEIRRERVREGERRLEKARDARGLAGRRFLRPLHARPPRSAAFPMTKKVQKAMRDQERRKTGQYGTRASCGFGQPYGARPLWRTNVEHATAPWPARATSGEALEGKSLAQPEVVRDFGRRDPSMSMWRAGFKRGPKECRGGSADRKCKGPL
jgi:hypothetical protein